MIKFFAVEMPKFIEFVSGGAQPVPPLEWRKMRWKQYLEGFRATPRNKACRGYVKISETEIARAEKCSLLAYSL
jgi:hypothetical protein